MAESAARTGPPGGAEKAPAVGSEEGVPRRARPPALPARGRLRPRRLPVLPPGRADARTVPGRTARLGPHGPACAVPGCLRHHGRSRSPARARAACRGRPMSVAGLPFRHPAGWDPEAATEAAFERNRPRAGKARQVAAGALFRPNAGRGDGGRGRDRRRLHRVRRVRLVVAAGVSAMRAQKGAVARRQSLEEAAAKTHPAAFRQMEEDDGADRRRQDQLAEDRVAPAPAPAPSAPAPPPSPASPPSPGPPGARVPSVARVPSGAGSPTGAP